MPARIEKTISIEDVIVRVVGMMLFVSIAAGLTIQLLAHSPLSRQPIEIALYAYLIGSIGGFLIAAPLVHTFMVARLRREIAVDVEQIRSVDSLTGLLNRQEFIAQVTRQETGPRSSPCFFTAGIVLLVDVDGLKKINEQHGHAIGDTALAYVASSIRGSIRDIDFVSRMAGEEFGVFLPSVDQERGIEIAERIRKTVNESTLFANNDQLALSVSIGTVQVTRSSQFSSSLKEAGLALENAKLAGRNCVFNFIQDYPPRNLERVTQAA